MKTIKCKIAGLSPLMMYRYVHGYNTPKVVEDPRAEAAKRLHFSTNGELDVEGEYEDKTIVVPQDAIFRTLMNGGKFEKIGKRQVTTEKASLFPGYVQIPGMEFELEHKGWEVDIRCIVTAKGDRVPVYRPRFDLWAVEFEIVLLTPDTFGPDLMRKIVDHAGRMIGLLSFRPERKGGFGTFHVVNWEVSRST